MARIVTVVLLLLGVMLLAAPASADHEDPDGDGTFCVDSSTAHAGDPMATDTQTGRLCAIPGGGGVLESGGGIAGTGGVGAVPTRIDAGGGGTSVATGLPAVGLALTGAASAAAAVLARRRRRH